MGHFLGAVRVAVRAWYVRAVVTLSAWKELLGSVNGSRSTAQPAF